MYIFCLMQFKRISMNELSFLTFIQTVTSTLFSININTRFVFAKHINKIKKQLNKYRFYFKT